MGWHFCAGPDSGSRRSLVAPPLMRIPTLFLLLFRITICDDESTWQRNPGQWNGLDGWMLPIYHEAVAVTWKMNKLEGRHNGSLLSRMREDMAPVAEAFESFDFPVFVMNLQKRPEKRRRAYAAKSFCFDGF